jgi:hypothetical protein
MMHHMQAAKQQSAAHATGTAGGSCVMRASALQLVAATPSLC